MSVNSATTSAKGGKRIAQDKGRSSAVLGNEFQNTSSPKGGREGGSSPIAWKFVRLGDIAQTTSGGTPRRDKPHYYGGTIPWVKSGELGDRVVYETSEALTEEGLASSNAKIFPKGTLCIALYGATVGKLGILGIDAATNQAVCAVFPTDELDTRYLYRFFEGKRRELIEQGKGGAQSNISQGIIRDTILPVPPLDEQRRIVAEIEKQFTRLDAGVAALRRVQANLKRYRAAVLKAACEGRLVPTEAELAKSENRKERFESGEALLTRILTERRKNWMGRGQYKAPSAPDTNMLDPLPEGWVWASVGQVANVALGKMLDKTKHHKGRKLPYLRNINVRWGQVDIGNLLEMFFDDDELERFGVRAGDVLVCEGGEPGRAAVWDGRVEGVMYQKAIHRLRFFGNIQARYLVFILEFLAKTGRLEHWFTGSTIKHFTRESFVSLPIPLPPLAEQTRIVVEVERRLSVVEELDTMVSANLQRAAGLRQSILQKAFTGGLV